MSFFWCLTFSKIMWSSCWLYLLPCWTLSCSLLIYVVYAKLAFFFFCHLCCLYPYHPCMVYLPTFTIKNQPNVGEYAIHGSYSMGYVMSIPIFSRFFSSRFGSCRNIKCDLGVLWPMQHENDLEICVRKRCLEKSTHISPNGGEKCWFTNVESKISP